MLYRLVQSPVTHVWEEQKLVSRKNVTKEHKVYELDSTSKENVPCALHSNSSHHFLQ